MTDYFDWKYYINKYKDLKNINTKEKALNHWLKYGIKEKRICNKIFEDVNFKNFTLKYKKNNLNDVYNDYYKENKVASDNNQDISSNNKFEYFDWLYYLKRNKDLIKAGIINEINAKKHWIRFGINEKRICNKIFDGVDFKKYALSNNINITDINKLYNHYYKNINTINNIENNELEPEQEDTVYDINIFYSIKNKIYRINDIHPDIINNLIKKTKFNINEEYILCNSIGLLLELQDKNSLLYKYVLDDNIFENILNKNKILSIREFKLIDYNLLSIDEIKELKCKLFPLNSFIFGIYGNITIDNYPIILLEVIKKLRNTNLDVYLLIVKNENTDFDLPNELYQEIKSYDWIKTINIEFNENLNYLKMCDVLATSYWNHLNNIEDLFIEQLLLCDKPILCKKSQQSMKILGSKYSGLYDGLINIPSFKYIKNNLSLEDYYQNYYNFMYIPNINYEINNALLYIKKI